MNQYDYRVAQYLEQLALVCAEVSAKPQLVRVLIQLLLTGIFDSRRAAGV